MKLILPIAQCLLFITCLKAQVPSQDGTFSAVNNKDLSLRTNTTERLTILGSGTKAGYVGINTKPDDWLHVNGNIRASQINLFGGILNSVVPSGNTAVPNLSFRTNNTARMTILGTSGYVGIGADIIPTNQLQIGPNPNAWAPNDLVVSNANGGLAINTNATETYLWGSKDISIRPGNSGNFSIYAKSDGNVGIGTNIPRTKLQVNTNSSVTDPSGFNYPEVGLYLKNSNATDNNLNAIAFSDSQEISVAGILSQTVSHTSHSGNLLFYTRKNGGAIMPSVKITEDGNVVIGTASPNPSYKLDVAGTLNATSILVGGQPMSTGGVTSVSGGNTGLVGTTTAGVATLAGTLKINNGGTGVTTVTTTPTASAFAGWDGNRNITANNFVPLSTNLVNTGVTTALSASSAYYQNAKVAQTIKLPDVTSLSNGHQFFIKNSSSQPVTVQTSAGTLLQTMAANATLALTCIDITAGTGTASWQWVYNTNTAGTPASQWTTSGTNITYGTGNIGIGTFVTSPAERLSIRQTATAFALTDLNITNTSYNTFKIWGNSQNVFGLGVGAETKGAFNPQLLFNGSNNWVLIPSAKLAIGTATPSANVHFVSPSSSNPINALKIEVASFSTPDNAANSSYFSVKDISANSTPFIIKGSGRVGIGTSSPDQMLTVNGQIHAKDVKVDASVPAPDYVFEKDYPLLALDSIKNYIDHNKHLPDVPSAYEFEKKGLNLGEMNMLLLKKVEELTLYLIQQQKEIDELKKKVEQK